jgi:galactokinase
MAKTKPFRVIAPGRVCLFGEHSDYLGLDVIPAAINLSMEIAANPRDDNRICIDYVDLSVKDEFPISMPINPQHKRDYLRSAFNIIYDLGSVPEHGWNLQVSGNVPIAGGLSSSSALSVASVMAAAHISDIALEPVEIVQKAYEAEVERFGESGGMMDHYASTFGGIIHVPMDSDNKVTRLPGKISGLVIGDSLEKKKDTVGDLRNIRQSVETGFKEMNEKIPGFDRRTTPVQVVSRIQPPSPDPEFIMAEATLRNRDLTMRGLELLNNKHPSQEELGDLLNKHHSILRYSLARSTPKIDMMIDGALKAGALGCKVNGSGGGGTMLAYAPGTEEEVSEAIRRLGGVPYRVAIAQGASLAILRE